MSVKATTTVSIAPASTSARSSSSVSTARHYRGTGSGVADGRHPRYRRGNPYEEESHELAGPSDPRPRRGRAHAPPARLCAGALPRDGRVLELRDLVHDHLDPRRLPDVLLHRVQLGRPDRGDLGLADRRLLRRADRTRDGGGGVVDADGRGDLLLVLEARLAGVGLVLGLVQPDRADRRDGRDRLRRRDVLDVP